jgi:hypothetical protein
LPKEQAASRQHLVQAHFDRVCFNASVTIAASPPDESLEPEQENDELSFGLISSTSIPMMNPVRVRNANLRKDLRLITWEGCSYCLMSGMGESSFAPFVLAMNYGEQWAGLVATLPVFLGSILQNASPHGILSFGSLRRWSVFTVSVQALAFLPLALGAHFGQLSLLLIFASVSLYWAGGLSTGASWNTWMDSVVPKTIRGRYFSRRSAVCNLLQWSSMLVAGYLLNQAKAISAPLSAFAVLFVLAGASRAVGAFLMSHQSEPEPLPSGFRVLGIKDCWAALRSSPQGGLLLYILAAQFSLQIAVPYLVPYLLGPLKLSYAALMGLMATAVLARICALPLLEKNTRHWSARRLLKLSGSGLCVVPLLWLWTQAPIAYYIAIQILTGSLMACYDLALLFVYLEAIPAADRASVLSRFRLFDTLAMLAGSLLGGYLLEIHGSSFGIYRTIFVASAIGRLAATFLLGFNQQEGSPQKSQETPA